MAKNSIRDYSATNSSNTDIQSIDISEGCSPAGINNAIREVMADLKDVSTGAVALESPSADSLTVTGDLTVDTNTLYVDSTNNNVGIGTSSPSKTLHVSSGTYSYPARITSTGGTTVGLEFTNTGSGANPPVVGSKSNDIFFETNNSERLRIDSSGNLLVGTTSVTSTSNKAGISFIDDNVNARTIVRTACNSTAATTLVDFINGNGYVGSIVTSGSATSYNTSSDYRLKENVTADWNATTRLKQLNPVRFNFISDADTTVDGFLAHEVQDVVPEAISGTKDAMRDEEYEVTPAVLDDDGNVVTPAVMGTRSVPDYQGIDQSKLVPLLVKTIQELEARIAALETA
jgi:hypothetical protein